jgi:dihydroflavonol-4-reductase
MADSMQDAVLVTGATGHLGYHLVHELNRTGIVPRVLLREPVGPEAWGGLRVRPVPGDLETAEPEDLLPALQGIDTVFHLAALVSLLPRDAARIDRINRLGTMALARAASQTQVRRLVHVSVAASVGACREGPPRDESSAWNLGNLRIPYLQSKRAAEEWLLGAASEIPSMPEMVVANPSLLVGPPMAVGRRHLGVPAGMTRRALSGLLHFYVDGRMNLVDVRDVAAALVRLAHDGRAGERYLLAGPPTTIREILDAVAEFIPLGRLRVRLPRRLLVWAAIVGSILEPPARRVDEPASGSVRDCFRLLDYAWSFSTEKAQRELGFRPTPIRESLAEIFRWAESRGLAA